MAPSLSTSLLAGLGFVAALASPASGTSFRSADDEGPGQAVGGLVRRGGPAIWPGGIVPYVLADLPHWLSEKIRRAIRTWEQNTCVRFLPKTDQNTTWVSFSSKDSGCWGQRGYPGANQSAVYVNFGLPNLAIKIASLTLADRGCGGGDYTIAGITQLIKMGNLSHVPIYDKRPTAQDFKDVNNAYNCAGPTTLAVPKCITVQPAANPEFSSYDFTMDEQTLTWMRTNKYDTLRVVQICLPEGGNPKSLGHVKLDDGMGHGKNHYIVKRVPRCRNGRNRHSSRYEIHLCKGKDGCDRNCRGTEDGRRVCPHKDNKPIDSKAVDVVDPTPWVCHDL